MKKTTLLCEAVLASSCVAFASEYVTEKPGNNAVKYCLSVSAGTLRAAGNVLPL